MSDPAGEEDDFGADQAPEPEESGPNRRCIASGAVKPAEGMLRFVIGPDGTVVPDLAHKLPGRGIWLSADRDMVNTATKKNLFSKAARRKVTVPADLGDRVEFLLLRHCLELIGLARRAGQAMMGYDGRGKVRALAPNLPLVDVLTGDELGAAFGRDHAVHVILTRGRLAEALRVEAGRLAGFRPDSPAPPTGA